MNWEIIFTIILALASVGLSVLLAVLLTKRFGMRKMQRTIMKAEHNYQQQITTLQQQLSSKVDMLENIIEKLTLSNQELSRLSDIKSKFMSVVAHDLRQPLSSIQGLTSVLMMDNSGGAGGDQRMLNNILKASDNMNMLMSDLIDISMIEAGKFKMDFKEFDFNGLINDVYSLQQVNAEKKGIILKLYDYPEPVKITADRFRLSQVLNNLLNNSVKFTPQGGRVEIRYLVQDGDIKVFVKDNGPGIEHSELSRIFEKFHQSDSNDKRSKRQGWGLGLSISYEIVKAHQGEIAAASSGLGQGAEFWLKVPLKHNEHAAFLNQA